MTASPVHFDVYKRVTDDLLNSVTIPSGSNFSNTCLPTWAVWRTKGCRTHPELYSVSTNDMLLSVGFNATYNINKITKLLLTDDPGYIGILYGDAFTGRSRLPGLAIRLTHTLSTARFMMQWQAH
jgi:TonB-dependent starch-binding outer membrane protein SusC